ncbi:unnamed protein product, partial [Cyprideis torosa]
MYQSRVDLLISQYIYPPKYIHPPNAMYHTTIPPYHYHTMYEYDTIQYNTVLYTTQAATALVYTCTPVYPEPVALKVVERLALSTVFTFDWLLMFAQLNYIGNPDRNPVLLRAPDPDAQLHGTPLLCPCVQHCNFTSPLLATVKRSTGGREREERIGFRVHIEEQEATGVLIALGYAAGVQVS